MVANWQRKREQRMRYALISKRGGRHVAAKRPATVEAPRPDLIDNGNGWPQWVHPTTGVIFAFTT